MCRTGIGRGNSAVTGRKGCNYAGEEEKIEEVG